MAVRGPDKKPRKGHPLNPAEPKPRSRAVAAPVNDSPTRARRAIALRMYCEGKSTRAIAQHLGVDDSAVWRWAQEPEFRATVDEAQQAAIAEARQILRMSASRAALRLAAIAAGEVGGGTDADGRTIRADTAEVQAAREVLDRVGVTATQVLDLTVRGDVRELTDADLDRLIAERMPRDHQPTVIDATATVAD